MKFVASRFLLVRSDDCPQFFLLEQCFQWRLSEVDRDASLVVLRECDILMGAPFRWVGPEQVGQQGVIRRFHASLKSIYAVHAC